MRFGIGQPATRKEDRRFLTGQGRFVGDIDLPKPRTLATMGSAGFAAQCNDIRLAFSGRAEAAEF